MHVQGSRVRALVVVAAVVGGLAAPAAAQADAVGLTGETLTGAGPGGPNGVPTTNYTCNPTGTSSADFSVSGTATGPYPGTFTATGSVSYGPETNPSGFLFVHTFTEHFTIQSANGTVTGTKQLATTAPNSIAF